MSSTVDADASPSRGLLLARWLIPLGFFALQCVVVVIATNGPFLDEAVNATIGLQIWRRLGPDVTWLGGSAYVFPVLAGAAYGLGGLLAVRALTAALYTLTLITFHRFVSRLFDERTASWATGGLAINGLFFSLGHFAVYDSVAILMVCGAAYAAVRMSQTGRVRWAVACGVASSLAIIAKYPTVIALVPMLALSMVDGRPRRTAGLMAIVVTCVALAVSTYMYLVYGFVVPQVAWSRALNEPAIFDRPTLIFQVGYALSLPLALALAAVSELWQLQRRRLAVILFGASLPWPILHVVLDRYVSLVKDCAFGFLALYPLVGFGMARRWTASRRFSLPIVVAAAIWGAGQCYWQDRSWGDLRPVVRHLLPQLRPSDRVALEHGWDLSMYVVMDRTLSSSVSVIDRYKYEHGEDVCEADWIVGSRSDPEDTSDAMTQAAVSCGFVIDRLFPYEFFTPLPPLVTQQRWQYVLFRRSPRSSAGALGARERMDWP